jgi:hypothetical protein
MALPDGVALPKVQGAGTGDEALMVVASVVRATVWGLGVVIQHSLKVGGTTQYVPADSPAGTVSSDPVAPNGNVWRGLTCGARRITMLYEGLSHACRREDVGSEGPN